MSEHAESSPVATFPHDAVARMRQLQQLESRTRHPETDRPGQLASVPAPTKPAAE